MSFSGSALLPLVPLLIFVPAIISEFTYPINQIAVHGELHLGYIYQLQFGATPIDNVFLPGYPANYYWLYHAYIAAVSSVASVNPAFAASFVNVLAIISALLWLGQSLIALGICESRTFYLGAAIVLVYSAVNITAVLSLASHQIYQGQGGVVPPWRWVLIAGALRRLHGGILENMLLFGSLALSVMAFCAALYTCIQVLRHKTSLSTLVMVTACVIIPPAIQPVGTLYVACVLFGGLGITVCVSSIVEHRDMRRIISGIAKLKGGVSSGAIVTWVFLSMALVLPLLKYVNDMGYNLQHPLRFGISGHNNISMIAGALLPFVPLFALQFIYLPKNKDSRQFFIQVCATFAMGLTAVLALPNIQQYKGTYFLAILVSMSALFALENMKNGPSKKLRQVSKIIGAALFILVFTKLGVVEDYSLSGDFYQAGRGFRYEKTNIVHEGELDGRMSAYYWIRDNTSHDVIVVTPLFVYRLSHIVYERMSFVRRKVGVYVDNIPAYDFRSHLLERFYGQDNSIDENQKLITDMLSELPGKQLYAVVKDSEVSENTMRQRGATLVYDGQNDGANVYLLNPGSETS